MKQLTFGALIIFFCAALGFAQTASTTGDYHKFEVFGGYSNNQVDVGVSDDYNDFGDFFEDRQSFNGVEASGVGNVNRYLGVKGDFSAHFKNYRFNAPRTLGSTVTDRFQVDASVYNFLGGVQVKDNAVAGSRLRPFGHALVGVAHNRSELDNSFFSSSFCRQAGVDCRQDFGTSDTGFAASIGGGLDIKATDRFSIRAIQVDYNPNRFDGSTQNNFRFGAGIVFH